MKVDKRLSHLKHTRELPDGSCLRVTGFLCHARAPSWSCSMVQTVWIDRHGRWMILGRVTRPEAPAESTPQTRAFMRDYWSYCADLVEEHDDPQMIKALLDLETTL